jgi:hypothetical protein
MNYSESLAGYSHPAYANSLSEFGAPLHLQKCGGWLLERQIDRTGFSDASMCYPLFSCERWSLLRQDLDDLGDRLVAVTMVTDPFGEYDVAYLRESFHDVVAPFKRHFAIDLSASFELSINAHHRRNARKALQEVEIEVCRKPLDQLEDWKTLYEVLKKRHRIRGIAAFSDRSFEKQLAVPGIVAFRAMQQNDTVGMLLWYLQRDRAYYHLGAYSQRGYELNASFALFQRAIDHFSSLGLRWLNLGAGAGIYSGGTAGLTRFKEGWSNASRTAYLCGRILDRKKYDELVSVRKIAATDYFPAYRFGEYG